jgi:hypothetical protein
MVPAVLAAFPIPRPLVLMANASRDHLPVPALTSRGFDSGFYPLLVSGPLAGAGGIDLSGKDPRFCFFLLYL